MQIIVRLMKNEMGFFTGFISNLLDSEGHADVVVMGDFNFDILLKCGYVIFKHLLDELIVFCKAATCLLIIMKH